MKQLSQNKAKKTYHSMTLFFFGQGLHTTENHLAVLPKQKSFPANEITGLVLKTPCPSLGHTQDWLNIIFCDSVIMKPAI